MRAFKHVSEIRTFVHAAKEDGKSIGLVPTMGALHEGHLSLMRKARSECDVVIVSIFVNPTQFGPNEDLNRYPRSLARDSVMVQEVGADALFTPSIEEMYAPGSQTTVDLPVLGDCLEGEARPGHFRGVATICAKLFNIVQPDRAYYGRKDYQQLKVIERMVSELHFPITIVPMPIVREHDGLALSSRNQYLTPRERIAATVLSRTLDAAKALYNNGERSGPAFEMRMHAVLAQEPLAGTQYAVAVDAETLEHIEEIDRPAVALLAVVIGSTRLIDNTLLDDESPRTGHKP